MFMHKQRNHTIVHCFRAGVKKAVENDTLQNLYAITGKFDFSFITPGLHLLPVR